MPPSRTEPEARTKRRRRVYACDSCYRKKIKCDGTLPRCDWCFHHSIPCTYTRNQEVATPNLRNAQEQEKSTPEIFYTPPAPQPVVPQGFGTDLCFAGQSLGNICGFNGLPFFSPGGLKWIRERTGDNASLDSYSSNAPHVWPPTLTRDEHESRERVELPDKKVIRQHLEAYQMSIHGQLFPFLNPPCFEHTIRAAYDGELSELSPSVICARGCIFGFMAMASYLTVPPREDAIMSADKYAREVQDMLSDISREPVTLDGLQAVIMLCFCCTALSGDVFKMELLLSWAVRYIFHLKGNLYPTIAKGEHAHAKLHVRNLFWICFIQDKFFGLRTGLTPLFDPMNCDLTLPGCEHGHSDPRSFHPSHSHKPSGFTTIIRLSIVQSEIYRGLYSCPALRQSDAELLATIRRLDSALEEWWSSVPVFTDDIQNDPTMADLLFKMQYHYCMSAIHQTSSRCTAWVRNQDTRVAGSSLAISIGASRAVLNRFLDTSPQLLGQFLMFCLPELTTSNIHLFSNILTNPLDRASWTDLELMRITTRHVKDHLWQEAPASFTAQVKLVERFMGDLQRLAECAIVKAQRERGLDRIITER
ncbi:C6 zinc finger domain protein [Aspergillus keveii]|uniref:C6 zinc finger domain protein n=1 Tax=Aspergillus keveii TaxID=714993 RepID=A0ABR4GEE5_9EURO